MFIRPGHKLQNAIFDPRRLYPLCTWRGDIACMFTEKYLCISIHSHNVSSHLAWLVPYWAREKHTHRHLFCRLSLESRSCYVCLEKRHAQATIGWRPSADKKQKCKGNPPRLVMFSTLPGKWKPGGFPPSLSRRSSASLKSSRASSAQCNKLISGRWKLRFAGVYWVIIMM